MPTHNIIVLWSGTVADIPDGWSLCDGLGGRPDLRNKFIVPAGGAYAPGDEGGASPHNHSLTSSPHNHTLLVGAQLSGVFGFGPNTSNEVITATSDNEPNLPLYFSLAYVMKD